MRWPTERRRLERLRREGRPRLLLVESGIAPPDPADCLEDWIRVPADDIDLKVRAEGVLARNRRHRVVVPSLDGGVLRVGEARVALSPLECRLAEVLVARMGSVVSRDSLARAGWPEGTNARNTLDVHVVRLRRRLGSVGLSMLTVRSRGYLLKLSDTSQESVHEA